ncbi:hypothetical protein K1719_046577 [Acacia pycnantha]|nr:hypothetical protein K1719_046577 [Acacia pycnantha]
MEEKRVVVILDASRDVNPKVLRWSLDGLSLKPGDKLTLVAVLYQFYTPSMCSSIDAGKQITIWSKQESNTDASCRRMEEYQNNDELLEISKLYDSHKVEFKIELVVATSAKEVALKKAKELDATWVILDRQMKKDEKYFLQELSCGISRLKRNDRIEHLRGPPVLPTEIYIRPEPGCHDDEDNSVEGPKTSQLKQDHPIKEEEIQRKSDKENGFTLTDISNQTTQTKPDEPRTVVEEKWKSTYDEGRDLMHATSGDLHIDRTNAEPMSHDQEDKTDVKQAKNIFGNTKSSICSVCKNRQPNSEWRKDFTYIELQDATDGFKNSLSEGDYRSTFIGQLNCQLKIVVKQHQLTDSQVEKQMMSQVKLILKARHKNVAMLLGSSIQENQLLAVYEYACNGSLDKYLSKKSCRPLSWRERVKIAFGVSMGLKYLHDNDIIHGNIKPSNILLNHEFKPMLGDFSFGRAKREVKMSNKDKSLGYTAPECLQSLKLTAKTDVYSLGMVLLGLITGQMATDKIPGEKSLIEWAKPLLGRKSYPQLVDPRIGNSYEEEQLHWLAHVTEQCLKKNPKERFSMNMVISSLQGLTESEEGCVTVDFSPEISNSTCSIPDITCSQGQTKHDQLTEEKQINSCHNGEEMNSELTIEHNDMLYHRKGDHLSHGVEKSLGKEKRTNHMVALTKVDTLELDQAQSSFIRDETTIGQIFFDRKGDMLDEHQGEVILDGSKSFVCSICKSRRSNIGYQRDFNYNELEAATDRFSFQNSLSEGGNGPMFRGVIDCKLKIAVKMHQITSSQEEEMFKSEVQSLTKAIHRNVVMLLGSCKDKNQQMLVYELACNGSLDQYLSGGSCRSLTWRERVKVAIGASRGLKYLHENNIIHGSIKPSNILLTHEFEPLLGDFGLGKGKLELKFRKDKNVSSEYSAPEYLEKGKPSPKTDVYSFGVVVLELITGRRATDKLSAGKSLVQWAKPLLGGKKYVVLVDSKISSSYKEDQLKWLVQVTEQCLIKNPKERSSMNMVVSALQDIEDTDDLFAIEDSFTEKSSIPLSVPDITCSQGLRNAHQQSQDEERISSIHMMCHIKDDQISQDQDETERSLQKEKKGTRLTTMSNQIASEEQTQFSFRGDSLDDCKVKAMLEDSKSSVCSICKSKRPNFGWQKDFSYDELHVATEGFSIKNSLTEGVYGSSFRGQLKCNMKIVIKQLQMKSSQEEKIFKSEVQFLLNARHENVVMLLGSCIDKTTLLIVYENACNGSLDQHLSGQSCRLLTWGERVKIAIGFSRGLKYLHENNTIHGSIKPSNIFLTHDFEALVGDFGFGKSKNELKNWRKNKNVENIGYEAPELSESGKVIDKVSGQKSLIAWAKPLLRGRRYPQLVDPKISSFYDDQELFSLVQVIEQCLRKNPKERLPMNMIISALPCIVDNKPPVTEDPMTQKPHFKHSLNDEYGSQDLIVPPQADNLEVIPIIEDPIVERPHLEGPLKDESSSQDIKASLLPDNFEVIPIIEDPIVAKPHFKPPSNDKSSTQDIKESPQADNLEVIPAIEDPIIEKPNSKHPLQDDTYSQDVKRSPQAVIDAVKERKNNETCNKDNEEITNKTFSGSIVEPRETGRLSPKTHQESQRRITYGGAKIFYLEGAKEYAVDEQFFRSDQERSTVDLEALLNRQQTYIIYFQSTCCHSCSLRCLLDMLLRLGVRSIGRMFELNSLHFPEVTSPGLCVTATSSSLDLWHGRLAHPSLSKLRTLLSRRANPKQGKHPLQDDTYSQDVKRSPQAVIDAVKERKNNETCNKDNEEITNKTFSGSIVEPRETGRLSPKTHQESQRRITYGGAKIFYLEGAKEYAVDEQFFRLGDRF